LASTHDLGRAPHRLELIAIRRIADANARADVRAGHGPDPLLLHVDQLMGERAPTF
jgi:hypothetical protein